MGEWLRRAAGILLVLASVGFALSRAPDRPVETLIARWAPNPSDFIEMDGLIVHFRDEGPRDDPTPLVLVHGTGASLHTWEGWARALRRQHRVISFDLPGFGLTGPLPEGSPERAYGGDHDARFVLGRHMIEGNFPDRIAANQTKGLNYIKTAEKNGHLPAL